METLTDWVVQIQDELDLHRGELAFGPLNVLSGLYLTLDQLRGVYMAWTHIESPPVRPSEGTSLMIPCNGVKRVSVPKGWAGG